MSDYKLENIDLFDVYYQINETNRIEVINAHLTKLTTRYRKSKYRLSILTKLHRLESSNLLISKDSPDWGNITTLPVAMTSIHDLSKILQLDTMRMDEWEFDLAVINKEYRLSTMQSLNVELCYLNKNIKELKRKKASLLRGAKEEDKLFNEIHDIITGTATDDSHCIADSVLTRVDECTWTISFDPITKYLNTFGGISRSKNIIKKSFFSRFKDIILIQELQVLTLVHAERSTNDSEQ